MFKCELCGHMRPSPCVGVGAHRVVFGGTSLGVFFGFKSENVILACPNFAAACAHERGPNGELVSPDVYDVTMDFDLCPQKGDYLVPADTVRKYVPSFDIRSEDAQKEVFTRAMQLTFTPPSNFRFNPA